MTAIQLNAEIYEALSIIAKDESLLKKAAKSLKRLASQKKDETLMSKEEFFRKLTKQKKKLNQGNARGCCNKKTWMIF